MEENRKIMLKVRKLDINFQSHTRKPENLFLKLLTKKKIDFCENMDKFKNLSSHEYFCSILQLTNHTYLSLDFTEVLQAGLRATVFPALHDSSKPWRICLETSVLWWLSQYSNRGLEWLVPGIWSHIRWMPVRQSDCLSPVSCCHNCKDNTSLVSDYLDWRGLKEWHVLTGLSPDSRWDRDTRAWVTGRSQGVHPLGTVLASK